ncbi:hypothetical protein CSC04_0848 [Enterobacter roggenkampii]|nr:hypothetical protein CSC04_0848 [Enterobacter roggenkampii]
MPGGGFALPGLRDRVGRVSVSATRQKTHSPKLKNRDIPVFLRL